MIIQAGRTNSIKKLGAQGITALHVVDSPFARMRQCTWIKSKTRSIRASLKWQLGESYKTQLSHWREGIPTLLGDGSV